MRKNLSTSPIFITLKNWFALPVFEDQIKTLQARKEKGYIEIDTIYMLNEIPAEAWEYRLGTYSALEWILERYKEKKLKDPTIAEKFNTYKLAEYKDSVIGLLQGVCTVSVETMKIVEELPEKEEQG
jgi:predicted helicase